jgi:hypothetical protein
LLQGILFVPVVSAQPINRKALVERHKVVNTSFDSLGALSVGNGRFAFTVDVTGLQSFPLAYQHGIPLGTQSEWGWHSFKDTAGYRLEETIKEYEQGGRQVGYAVQWPEAGRKQEAANWFRANPHRLQLGNLGLLLLKGDGQPAALQDLTNIHQELNPWTGIITSRFVLEGIPVEVATAAHPQVDAVAAAINSPLLAAGRMQVFLQFPYPTGEWTDAGANYKLAKQHTSSLQQNATGAVIQRRLDTTLYSVMLGWEGTAAIHEQGPHYFLLQPKPGSNRFSFSCIFSPRQQNTKLSFAQTASSSTTAWRQFWQSGGAIDFSGSTDPRAAEIERRVVLSQYLTRIQCAGSFPPQETGLTYNSWFGKPHLEMHWWHGVHYALWGRPNLLQNTLEWYRKAAPEASTLARRQGFSGLRWQKMTDHDGREGPSSIGAFLIWQQPHFIYFAELMYRNNPVAATLNKYKELLFATADFMAAYAHFDSARGRYILGPALIPAQERFKPEETFNPTFELAYWHWALQKAQQWRLRLNLPRKREWDAVLQGLSPLPVQDGVYLAAESAPDSYNTKEFMTDHPTVLGALGILPQMAITDTATMRRTFELVWQQWHWPETWGWDFPMTAMTATRLGMPDRAIDALLMDVKTNTFLRNGHNYQDDRLRLYLPGNGGLLAAVAMMVAGYDGAPEPMPGIPKNGQWKVRWEGLKKMP